MNWGRLILALLFYLYLPAVYSTIRSDSFGRSNLLLSVTLPQEARSHPEVLAYCRRFRRILLGVCLGLTAILLAFFLIPQESVFFTACSLWLIFGLCTLSGVYARGYHGLRQIKRSHGWTAPEPEKMEPAAPVKLRAPTKNHYFIIPLVLSMVPLTASLVGTWDAASQFRLCLTAILSTIFCGLCPLFHSLMFSHNGEELRGIQTSKQQAHWSRIWLFYSWLTAGYSTAVWLKVDSTAWYLLVTVFYTLMLLLAAMMGEFAVRAVQRRLPAFITDQDSCWVWGQFYYNHANPQAFVPKRMGIWMAPNFAQPAGRFFAGCCIVLLLILPFIGLWNVAEDFSPCCVTLSEDEEVLTVYHVGKAYTIKTDDIEAAALLDTLPDHTRFWGGETEHILKGTFSVQGYGDCTLCLEPDSPPFLLLYTTHGRYLFSSRNIRSIYGTLTD